MVEVTRMPGDERAGFLTRYADGISRLRFPYQNCASAIDNDPPVRNQSTKTLVSRALDLFVQIGLDPWGVRRIVRIGQVAPELRAGDVWIDDLWLFRAEKSTKDAPVWEQVGEMTRSRTIGGQNE